MRYIFKAHALHGVFQGRHEAARMHGMIDNNTFLILGHSVYGITDLALRATGLQAIVEDCAMAAKSHDARDKYFQSFVGEFGECSSKALRSELPALEVHVCTLPQFPPHAFIEIMLLAGSEGICGIYCQRIG